MKFILGMFSVSVGLFALIGCSDGGIYQLEQEISNSMEVTVGKVGEDGFLDPSHTCEGDPIPNKSPIVSWSGAPSGTESFVIFMEDLDSVDEAGASFVHWVVYRIPGEVTEMSGALASGILFGKNDFEKVYYVGPCPSDSVAHTYLVTVYALDSFSDIPPAESRNSLLRDIDGKVLASGQASVKFQKKSS